MWDYLIHREKLLNQTMITNLNEILNTIQKLGIKLYPNKQRKKDLFFIQSSLSKFEKVIGYDVSSSAVFTVSSSYKQGKLVSSSSGTKIDCTEQTISRYISKYRNLLKNELKKNWDIVWNKPIEPKVLMEYEQFLSKFNSLNKFKSKLKSSFSSEYKKERLTMLCNIKTHVVSLFVE